MATIETLFDENGYPYDTVTGSPEQDKVKYRIKCNTCGMLPELHEPATMRCNLTGMDIHSNMVVIFNY